MSDNIGCNIAKTTSIVLQPFLMPIYSVALLFVYTNFRYVYFDQALRFLIPVFILSFLFPFLFTFVLWKLKFIKRLDLYDRHDRILPYIIFSISTIYLTYLFYSAGISFWFVGFIFAFPLTAFVGFMINFFWKISTHMLAIGGLIGGVLSVSLLVKGVNPFLLFILLFLLAGCLGVSRLYLHKNTPAQVYVGFIIGLALAFATTYLGFLLLYLI